MSYKCNTKEYSVIQFSDLKFDEKIADMLESMGKVFPETLLGNIYDAGTFKLDKERLDSVFKGYETGLPPITVKKNMYGKYTLVNGRHRVCAALYNNHLSAPFIVED
jgi:hypothetical protein